MAEEASISITPPESAPSLELPLRAESLPQQRSNQPIREKNAIQKNLDHASNQVEETKKKAFEIFEGLPDAIQEECYEFVFLSENDQPAIETFIANHPDQQNELRQVIRLKQQGEIENQIVGVIQEELRPLALQDLVTEVHRVSARLDFDTILQAHENFGETDNYLPITMFDLTAFRRFEQRLATEADTISLSDIHFWEETIKRYENQWEEKHFLKDMESSPEAVIIQMDEEKFSQEKQALLTKIADFQQFKNLNFDYTHLTGGFGTAIGSELSHIEGVLKEETMLDPRFLVAADSSITRLIKRADTEGKFSDTRDEYLAKLTSEEPDEVFKNLQIKGAESTLSGVTEERIRTNVAVRIPAAMLKDANTVDIEQIQIEIGKKYGSGSYRHEYDTHGNIINKQITVKEPYFVNPEGDVVIFATESEFLYTLFHEIGHNAHMFLTYAEMKAWNHIVASDNRAVAESENHARQENDEVSIKREAFADSFALFAQNPALLLELERGKPKGENRFDYMFTLFGSRTTTKEIYWFLKKVTDQIAFERKYWDEQGKTPEQAKNEYLEKIKVAA